MSREKLTIQPMEPGDIQDVLELERKNLSPWNEEHLLDELQQATGFQFVVSGDSTEGRILAVVFGRVASDEAEILKLSVAEFVRNRGVGYQLLDFALNYCRSKGVKNCFLELRASNAAAQRLYEKRGFAKTGTRRNYYNEPVEDAILMRLALQ